jgi:putative protease
VKRAAGSGIPFRKSFPGAASLLDGEGPLAAAPGSLRRREALIVKTENPDELTPIFKSAARWAVLVATRPNLERMVRHRFSKEEKSRFAWSLPPLIFEKELDYFRRATAWYVEKGFLAWEVNNWGHFDLFADPARMTLTAGWRFNVRNRAALAALAESGCRSAALSLETTEEELRRLAAAPSSASPIVVVHAWPPLFISRLAPKLLEEKPITTPRREAYFLRRKGGNTLIYADRPMNWFEVLPTLRNLGYDQFMIDASDGPPARSKSLERLLRGYATLRVGEVHTLFNFDRSPFKDADKTPPGRG